MARRTTVTAAACTLAAAALVLTACGGGGDKKIAATTTGTPAGAPSASATTAPPTTTSAPGAPTFDFPPDVKVVVDPDTTGDAVKDAVLRDQGYGLQAIFLAIAKLDPAVTQFHRYVIESAAEDWSSKIGWGKSNHESITGTVLFYDRKVNVTGATTAGVTFCQSERNSHGKDTKSGKAIMTAPSLDDFTFHTVLMRKSADGTWQMANYKSQDRAKSCER
ncbi:hypothetical protein [Actinacidiphila rubida]|uniref:Lipoprotein n=1 Tax=Actinacidiphila rubida TaxID=310780 RepID=A0A1H8HTR4_9ACTN|nr:hypothetical protein [Actinacidiphila rubida]SEN59296.1 hypothetical protein SAMN05216267_100739 [Actinacidiphila rubida]